MRGAWIPALRALHENFPAAMGEAVLTHGSVEPLTIYQQVAPPDAPRNAIWALPCQQEIRPRRAAGAL